jgi:hypothetical protein
VLTSTRAKALYEITRKLKIIVVARRSVESTTIKERNPLMANRYEISDAAWVLAADPYTKIRRTRRPRIDDRLMLNGVLWVLCSGAAWRDLPELFGQWPMVYHRFRDWRNQGIFDQMLK